MDFQEFFEANRDQEPVELNLPAPPPHPNEVATWELWLAAEKASKKRKTAD